MTAEEAINILELHNPFLGTDKNLTEAFDMAIKALTAQQWIPCNDHTPDTPIRVQVQLDNGWIITAYRQEGEWLSVPDCEEALHDEWVIAWMPLPESYKGEQP